MAYQDQFKSTAYYYGIINRLVDRYRERGYIHAVAEWEKAVTKIADYPDLRMLAKKADFLYTNLKTSPLYK